MQNRQYTRLSMSSADHNLAFERLVRPHFDRLYRLAWRLTGAKAEAEDLTQDICLALPSKLGGFHGKARFTTWLYRVAVNAAHDRRRRAASRARAADGWGDWEINRRAAAEDTAAGIDWLQTAMLALPEEMRDTLALTLDDELTHAEAAEVLGVSEGTVSWRLSQIRKRLRALHDEELSP